MPRVTAKDIANFYYTKVQGQAQNEENIIRRALRESIEKLLNED